MRRGSWSDPSSYSVRIVPADEVSIRAAPFGAARSRLASVQLVGGPADACHRGLDLAAESVRTRRAHPGSPGARHRSRDSAPIAAGDDDREGEEPDHRADPAVVPRGSPRRSRSVGSAGAWHDAGPMAVITFAHRGRAEEAPENSLPAFRRALELGASGLETDVWLSADGEVVCTHDATVRAGLRRRRVADDSPSAARCARRAAARRRVRRARHRVRALGRREGRAAAAPALARRRRGARGARAAVGLLARRRRAARRCAPSAATSSSSTRPAKRAIDVPLERHAHDLSEVGIDAMNLHHTEWTAGLVSLFHRFGVRAFAWDTQEAPPRSVRCCACASTRVYCDRPDRMVAVVGEWRARRVDG